MRRSLYLTAAIALAASLPAAVHVEARQIGKTDAVDRLKLRDPAKPTFTARRKAEKQGRR